MTRSLAPIARKPNSAFSHAPSSSTRLPARPFEEPNAESQHSVDSAVQASPESSLTFPQNLTTIPLHRPGDPTPAESAPPSVQAKLTIGRPGDQHKPEAARTAAQITSPPEQSVQREAMPEEEDKELQRQLDPTTLQRQPEDDEIQQKSDDEDELQQKSEDDDDLQRQSTDEDEELKRRSQDDDKDKIQQKSEDEDDLQRRTEDDDDSQIQPKLTIGQPGDKYEQEADRTAAQVMAMPESKSSTPKSEIQNPKSKIHPKPLLQLKGNSLKAPKNFESQLAKHKGSGQPLSDETRAFMEPRFGADFSGVRVHEAPQESGAIGAQAFTHGQDIYFNSGKYNPGASSGKELLAHELTHTIQQAGGQIRSRAIGNHPNKNKKLQTKVNISLASLPSIQRKEFSQPQGKETPQLQETNSSTPSGDQESLVAEGEAQPQPKAVPPPNADDTSALLPPLTSGGGNPNQTNSANPAVSATQHESQTSVTSPSQDPAFQAVASQAGEVAKQRKQHDPAQSESQEAQDAAVPPGNEVESKAQDQQVGEMDQQQPGTFNAAAFKAALLEKIAAIIPENEEEADRFKEDNQLDSVKQDVSTQVTQEQEQAAGAIESKTQEPPDTAAIEPKPVTPMQSPEATGAASDIGAERAAPKLKPDAEVTAPLNAGSQNLDQQMAAANITEEQLAKSNEPQFMGALEAKQQAQTHAATAPTAYRQDEQGIVTQAQAEAQATAQNQLQGMQGQQAQSLQQVAGLQGETKGKDEQERSRVASDINGIYAKTKTDVEAILSQLDTEVMSRFDAGAGVAKQQFEDYVKEKMDAYKQERYGNGWDITKWGNAIRDFFVGLPPEVNQFFVDGRQRYLDTMDGCLTEIANLVADKLNQAKQRISQGKQEIQQYVVGLPQSLQQVGQEAAQNIQSKFDELEQSVDSKQDELLDTLAQKYQENLQEIDARIEEMKEENKGFIDKAISFIVDVAKVIAELAALIAKVLARVASVIPQILQDPIGFLSNLIEGLKQGFMNFMKNIGQHLQQGLISWLTGAIAGAGLQMPETLDLKGIFSLVTQVLGFTYQAIRAMVVKRVKSEETVSQVEQSVGWFQALATEGPEGLWPIVQEKIGDLKAMFLDPLKNFVIVDVVRAGIEWILSLMNPASAFVKACKMIYQIITFFMENAERIVDLVNAILDSITAIAAGSLGKAAQLVESSMAKSLPVMISFLAKLVGLGNISQKVQGIIQKIRKPIEKAINWVVDRIVKLARKIGKKLKKTSKTGKDLGTRVFEWWKAKEKFKTEDGEQHTLFFKGQDKSADLMVASTPKTLETFIGKLKTKEKYKSALSSKEGEAAISQIETLARKIDEIKSNITAKSREKKSDLPKSYGQEAGKQIGELLSQIKQQLEIFYGVAGQNSNDPKTLPPTQVTLDSTSGGDGKKMIAEPLSLTPGNSSGSQPFGESFLWNKVKQRKNTYVRGHLLNHHLHGPGTTDNLTPITIALNGEMERSVEGTVKDLVLGQKKVVSYKVTVEYNGHGERNHISQEKDLATAIKFKIKQMKKKDGESGEQPSHWEINNNPKDGRIPNYPKELPHTLPEDIPISEDASIKKTSTKRSRDNDGDDAEYKPSNSKRAKK
ncbi:MAG: DUF4157 domain-containing protein [Synechococcales bacterium]|nr:DUF4157 domain-containing protein [Synechococcales bacterium]